MPELGKSGAVRDSVTTSSGRRQDVYQRYAATLYQQALLSLGDPALAGQVVCDVIVDECAHRRAPGRADDEDDTRYRLAESIFRSCQQLAVDPAQRDQPPAQQPSWDVADSADPARLLSKYERGALGLVLFGGLGYVRASSVLRIDPRDMADLLRTVLRRLARSAD